MFRISLLICFSLTLCITAKPWNKLTDAFQETFVSIDGNGKMTLGKEVEPLEDMDEIQYEFDPRMKNWESVVDNGKDDKQAWKAEEDLDDVHHPSVADLLQVQTQNLEFIPAGDVEEEPSQADTNMRYSQEAEEGKDDMNHPDFFEVSEEEPEQDWDEAYRNAKEQLDVYLAPMVAEYRTDGEVRGVLYELEKDEDDLGSPVQTEPLRMENLVRVHLKPEEDMDDLYHQELPVLDQNDNAPRAGDSMVYPSERWYSEPEEDLDDLYHQ